MDTGKIERAAVRAVEEYIDKSNKLVPYIDRNDRTPIWDGFIYMYNDKKINNNNFFARVPLQVKGTTVKRGNYYRIERKYIEGYKIERGTAFFMVQKKDNVPMVLYALLSSKDINSLLSQPTESIKIKLKEVPKNHLEFEKELFEFATKRNSEKVDNPAPEEVKALMEGFEKMKVHLGEVEDKDARYDLESLLIAINELKNDGTVGWRDKFIYYSRKALDLAIKNLKNHDFTMLQFGLGKYLHDQKQYHLVEDYYLKSLGKLRKLAEVSSEPSSKSNVAIALNNLGNLYFDIKLFEEAGQEYHEALDIRRELAKTNRDTYIIDVAKTVNNLAVLHKNLNRYEEAEREYQEALEYYRELAKNKYEAHIGDVAMTLNNLAVLHKKLTRYKEAEKEYQEALKYYRVLAQSNHETDLTNVATTLNNLAILHKCLAYYKEAEQEYQESLTIYRKLAKTNHDAYIEYVARILSNLATLHVDLTRYDEAEQEYRDALEIRRELAATNRDAYIGCVASTLNNLAVLHKKFTRNEEAEQEYQEALKIYRELAATNHDAYIEHVARTLNNLAVLHKKLARYKEAEQEYQEALEIRRELVEMNHDVYSANVANTRYNLALLLQKDDKRLGEARDAATEALGIYKELAKRYPQTWNSYVEDTQRLLEELQTPNPSSSTKV